MGIKKDIIFLVLCILVLAALILLSDQFYGKSIFSPKLPSAVAYVKDYQGNCYQRINTGFKAISCSEAGFNASSTNQGDAL